MASSWEDTEAQMAQLREVLDRAHALARERVSSANDRAASIEREVPQPARVDDATIDQLRRARESIRRTTAAAEAELRRCAASLRAQAEVTS